MKGIRSALHPPQGTRESSRRSVRSAPECGVHGGDGGDHVLAPIQIGQRCRLTGVSRETWGRSGEFMSTAETHRPCASPCRFEIPAARGQWFRYAASEGLNHRGQDRMSCGTRPTQLVAGLRDRYRCRHAASRLLGLRDQHRTFHVKHWLVSICRFAATQPGRSGTITR